MNKTIEAMKARETLRVNRAQSVGPWLYEFDQETCHDGWDRMIEVSATIGMTIQVPGIAPTPMDEVAIEQARKRVRHALYDGFSEKLFELRGFVMQGDAVQAIGVLNELIKEVQD